jgi:hypothetical protein
VTGDNSYNFGIPNVILKSVSRAQRLLPRLRRLTRFLVLFFSCVLAAKAADWSIPEHQLALKIVAATNARVVSISFENRSSLGRRESEIIQNGLRSTLETMGVRFAASDQGVTSITITLSENVNSYVWVARITTSAEELSVVMVSAPRPAGGATHDSVPMSLRKTSLWEQNDRILDLAVLEENAVPTRIAVLGSERVSIYRVQSGRWQPEQALEIAHAAAWPRDLRGRIMAGGGHLFDVYLPGVLCPSAGSSPLSLACGESNDAWPLVSRPIVPAMDIRAAFASARNFFTGTVTPALGNGSSVPPFYSAASVARDNASVLWLFSGVDRRVHIIAAGNDRTIKTDWGSDIAAVHTSCGAGWQVLATTSADDGTDMVRAFEFPDRDPVAVSGAVDFPGPISALWTEARGDTAIVVAHNQESGSYEAFRLAVACSQ